MGTLQKKPKCKRLNTAVRCRVTPAMVKNSSTNTALLADTKKKMERKGKRPHKAPSSTALGIHEMAVSNTATRKKLTRSNQMMLMA